MEEMSKAKWKDPDYYHKWYERNREKHLANCKEYQMDYVPKGERYMKMWEKLKLSVSGDTLATMERMEREAL